MQLHVAELHRCQVISVPPGSRGKHPPVALSELFLWEEITAHCLLFSSHIPWETWYWLLDCMCIATICLLFELSL